MTDTTESVPALVAGLREYFKGEKASYHMPGHKQRIAGIHPLNLEVFGEQTIISDVSEMGGFDYLHAPESGIVEAQNNAARVFGADHTFFLVNGSTVGNLAAIFALSGQGDRVMMLRGSHRSVYSGTVLSGAVPVYLTMNYHEGEDGWFVTDHTKINEEELLAGEGRLAVIHITRPNYYGMACDLKPYVELARKTGAILVVDEAHGAHFGFVDGIPTSALQEGADIVIQSTHKTIGSLGQSSMMHLKGDRAKEKLPQIARALQMLQSSSPSALFEISLDLSACYMAGEGKTLLASTVTLAKQTREKIEAIPGLRVLSESNVVDNLVKYVDPTKIVIDVSGTGRSGFAASLWLRTNAKIWIELADFRRIVASITVGDNQESADLLVEALKQMADTPGEGVPTRGPILPGPPPAALPPREGLQGLSESIPLSEVQDRICAEYVIPYPPGIPLVAPGEILTAEILAALQSFRESGSRIVGPVDQTLATLRVISK
eukprot:TRINITY_DN13381_c0_g1_i1.p1 TRINITY_DN13381_c0_g1~~TRINITY_DN13381_c0_g1_i1.p1  ORF type:complete len:499 (-),score=142.36 TRINITY_DN13381_c0_g1_i1:23-1495(-)